MLVGQAQFGFNPFRAIVRAHVVGTRAIAHAIQNPNVQRAAITAAQAYGGNYATAAGYAQQVLPGQAPPPGAMPPPDGGGGDDGGPMEAPVKKGNLLPIAMIGGAALLVLLMLKK